MIRASVYIGLVLALGALIVPRWIAPHIAASMRRYLRIGVLAGVSLVCAGTAVEVAQTLARVAGAFDLSLVAPYVLETRQGSILALRISLALLVIPVSLVTTPRGTGDAAVLALGVALLSTFSLTSHAAATGRTAAVAIDLVHMAAMAAWVGTLAYVAWLPLWRPGSRPSRDTSAMIRRLSAVGLVSAMLVVATGLYAAVTHLWGPLALGTTPYGQALMWKTVAVLVVLAMAGVNRWALVPAIGRYGTVTSLGRWLKVETLGMVAVLAITGVLVGRPVPEAPATVAAPVRFRENAGSWLVHGVLMPAGTDLELELIVTDPRGRPAPDAVDVRVAVLMLDHPMDPDIVPALRVAPGAFRAAIVLPMAGRWELRIRVAGEEARVPVRAAVGDATGIEWSTMLPSATVLLLGVVIAGVALDWRRLPSILRVGLAVGGGLAAIVGLVLAVRLLTTAGSPTGSAGRQNPVAATPESRGIGRRIYAVHCQMCHGSDGRGDGPLASTLRPRPADLRVHMGTRPSDEELFDVISNGITGTAMPAFERRLSEAERWHVLNYVRGFVKDAGGRR